MQFYRLYRQPVFTFIHHKIKDQHIAEEITQDVFVDCIEKIREDHNIQSLSAYLYAIAHNKTVDHIRKKKLKKIIMSAVPEPIINTCAMIMFRDDMSQQEVKDQVYAVLHRLPHEYALVIRLKYIEGFHVLEIAERLDMSFKSAESLLFRARKAFTKLYRNQ